MNIQDRINQRQRRLCIAQDSIKADFEDFCRQPSNFYTLMPSEKEGQTYWALQTERAFQIWKAAVARTMEGMS